MERKGVRVRVRVCVCEEWRLETVEWSGVEEEGNMKRNRNLTATKGNKK